MILDTNALSDLLSGEALIRKRLQTHPPQAIPAVVIGEYLYGIKRHSLHSVLAKNLNALISGLEVLPVNEATAVYYAEVREALRVAGTPIPANDIWIAALARQHSLQILSRDTHFDRVTGVQRLGW